MKVNCLLLYLSILSLYIIVAYIFDIFKIPYSLFNEIETTRFNVILSSIAGSYLMGVFIYSLTVVYKNKIERGKRKWEINDLFRELEKQNDILDEKIGSDFGKTASMEWFKQDYNNEMNENLIHSISSTIEKINLYRDLLTEKEIDQLNSICTNLCIENITETSTPDDVKINFERLKQIYNSIKILNNSIVKYIQRI